MTATPLEAWFRLRPLIEAAVRRAGGAFTIEDVEAAISEGKAQFWPGDDCAVVTEWIAYPRFRALNIWLMGGDLNELLGPMWDSIEAWAKENGAQRIEGGAYDRPGWQARLSAIGMQPRWIMFVKELRQ